MTRVEKEKEFRRSHVAEIAEQLFLKQGFEKTTMDELAYRAEMSKSTLYTVFRSKAELLIYMHLRDAKIGYEILRASVKTGGTGYEQLAAYGKLFFQFYKEYPNKLLLRTYLDFKGLDPADARREILAEEEDHRQKEIQLLRGILVRGVDDGTLRSNLDCDLVMTQFVYSLHAIAKQSLFPTHTLGDWTAEHFFSHYLKLLLDALKSQPANGTPITQGERA